MSEIKPVACPLCGHSLSAEDDDEPPQRNAPIAVHIPTDPDPEYGDLQSDIDELLDRARTIGRTVETAIECPKCEDALALVAGHRNGRLTVWLDDWM